MIGEVPAKLCKGYHDHSLPPSATVLEQRLLLLATQHGPPTGPICHPRNYLYWCVRFSFINTISFLFEHIDQHSTVAPNKIWFLCFKLKPCSQEPNKSAKLEGGWIPKVICTIFQTKHAKWQSKNRCWIVSTELQRQHLTLPYQFLLAKLSFVRVNPFFKYHIKGFAKPPPH